MKTFAATQKFVSEVRERKLKPLYLLVGDEAFFRKQCREAVLQTLVPPDLRDFSLHEFDLAETPIAEVLDSARTPSLMAPFQVIFVRGVKSLYGRGSHDKEFAAVEDYAKNPNPDALVILVADHISIPADVRRMDLQDKDRYERIRETLGPVCSIVELARVEEPEAVKWAIERAASEGVKLEQDAAREMIDALGGDMMLVANELEKLILYVGEKKKIALGDVETMVLAAKQRSLYELTDAISAHDRTRALAVLDALLSSGDGEEAAIGHLYMLAKTFRQMLVLFEKRVRDTRALWQALWRGFGIPPFAAEDVLRQARRYQSRRELTRALRLIARADLELRSSPVSKRLVLERLVLDLAIEPRLAETTWEQQQLTL